MPDGNGITYIFQACMCSVLYPNPKLICSVWLMRKGNTDQEMAAKKQFVFDSISPTPGLLPNRRSRPHPTPTQSVRRHPYLGLRLILPLPPLRCGGLGLEASGWGSRVEGPAPASVPADVAGDADDGPLLPHHRRLSDPQGRLRALQPPFFCLCFSTLAEVFRVWQSLCCFAFVCLFCCFSCFLGLLF